MFVCLLACLFVVEFLFVGDGRFVLFCCAVLCFALFWFGFSLIWFRLGFVLIWSVCLCLVWFVFGLVGWLLVFLVYLGFDCLFVCLFVCLYVCFLLGLFVHFGVMHFVEI